MVKIGNRHTDLLEEEVIQELRKSSFVETKKKTGVNYRKQVDILKKFMKPFEANWKREKRMKSFSLGMDGHSFSGHDMVLTITNLDLPRVVSILHSDKKKDIDKFLMKRSEERYRELIDNLGLKKYFLVLDTKFIFFNILLTFIFLF